MCLCRPLFFLGHLILRNVYIIYQSLSGVLYSHIWCRLGKKGMYCFVLLLRLCRKLDSAGILWKREENRGDLLIKESLILCYVLPPQSVSSRQHSPVEHSAAMEMFPIFTVQHGSP